MNVLDEEKDGIWGKMDVENKSSQSWSPPATSPLTGVVVPEEIHVDARKNGKGKGICDSKVKGKSENCSC